MDNELEVPERALDELYTQRNARDRAAAVRAISSSVVERKLRREASRIAASCTGDPSWDAAMTDAAEMLRSSADRLVEGA